MPTATHVLVVAAQADADQFVPAGAPSRWSATVCDESPFSGLFAHGDTLHDARTALAGAVWFAVKNNPAIDTSRIGAVRILTVTRKTFAISTLDAALNAKATSSSHCPQCGCPFGTIAENHSCPTEAGS